MKVLTLILRYFLAKYYGLDKMIIMSNVYWPNRFDSFNLLDFILSNKQNQSFHINVGAHGLVVTGTGQPSHYYKTLNSSYEPDGKAWRLPDMKLNKGQGEAGTAQKLIKEQKEWYFPARNKNRFSGPMLARSELRTNLLTDCLN